MNVNKKEQPHRSQGEAKHRRDELAKARRGEVFDVNKRLIERTTALTRLDEINRLLSPNDMTLALMDDSERARTKAGLEIEQLWIQNKFELITTAERQHKLSEILVKLEGSNKDVYSWLTNRNGNDPTMLEKIRDKVMPPIRVAGYYTKR